MPVASESRLSRNGTSILQTAGFLVCSACIGLAAPSPDALRSPGDDLRAAAASRLRESDKAAANEVKRRNAAKSGPVLVQRESDLTSMGRYSLTIRKSDSDRAIHVPAKRSQ